MLSEICKIGLILPIAIAIAGCDGDTASNTSGLTATLNETSTIPDHWAQISLSKIESGGQLKVTLAGKKKTLKEIVDQISEDLSMPVKFGDTVDTSEKLEQFEFQIDDGSWTKLLQQIAEKFNCTVQESDTEFLITSKS